jgi:hypothetical protein
VLTRSAERTVIRFCVAAAAVIENRIRGRFARTRLSPRLLCPARDRVPGHRQRSTAVGPLGCGLEFIRAGDPGFRPQTDDQGHAVA